MTQTANQERLLVCQTSSSIGVYDYAALVISPATARAFIDKYRPAWHAIEKIDPSLYCLEFFDGRVTWGAMSRDVAVAALSDGEDWIEVETPGDVDTVVLEEGSVAAECMMVTKDGILWSASPKHSDGYFETKEISWEELEAIAGGKHPFDVVEVDERCAVCDAVLDPCDGENWDDLCPGCADAVSDLMDKHGTRPTQEYADRATAIRAAYACRVAEQESRDRQVERYVYLSPTGVIDIHVDVSEHSGRLLRKYTSGRRIDIDGKKEILQGPDGIQIVLDPDQVVPDDPGQGTPRIIRWMKDGREYGGSTLDCAVGTGEIDCYHNGFQRISEKHMKWLDEQQEYCDKWLDEQYDRICQQKETGG
jgi:hypothetical protein